MTQQSTIKVSTLADIKERLQARVTRDLDKLPTHEHEALGVVYIAHIPTQGYRDLELALLPAGDNYDKWEPEEKAQYHTDKLDRAYLKYGVITGDNKNLDDETIDLLIRGDYGAENRRLIQAIQKVNPPREDLPQELGLTYASSRMTLVLLRILERAGCLKQVRDYMLADDNSEDGKALAEDLAKWEETLPIWEGYLEADKAAKEFEIGVYARMEAEEGVELMNEGM